MSSSAPPPHSYGPACRLAPVSPPRADDGGPDGVPILKAHFFYSSPIPLDDPLSTPTIVGSADQKSHKAPLRPFSPGDNNSLEKAWLTLGSETCRKNHTLSRGNRSSSPSLSQENAIRLDFVVDKLVRTHWGKHDREGQDVGLVTKTPTTLPDSSVPICCSELLIDASAELRNGFCALTRERQRLLDQDRVIQSVMSRLERLRSDMVDRDMVTRGTTGRPSSVGSPATSAKNRSRATSSVGGGAISSPEPWLSVDSARVIPAKLPAVDDGISGRPFLSFEAGSVPKNSPVTSRPDSPLQAAPSHSSKRTNKVTLDSREPCSQQDGKVEPSGQDIAYEDVADILVGISRLYKVSLPILQMKPIYWSPVNDISMVMRATWFYKDGMSPIEPAVANQLEAGYRELRPWSLTWADELRSALDVGPLGEEKVSHPLWPEAVDKRSKGKSQPPLEPAISGDPFCAARCYQGEAAAAGTLKGVQPAQDPAPEAKPYRNYQVIYKSSESAYLLKPSLQPSAYYGRKPIAKIMRGLTVGVPVVRGFDWQAWESMNDKKLAQGPKVPVGNNESVRASTGGQSSCPACELETERGQVTDLVLVAHGIGQKIAERVESFHFTHAINAFRRAVNVELGNEAVKSVLRPGQNGIMVLPVNWRHVLKFEEGGLMTDEDKATHAADGFTLKDIEPGTIPAVRSMISDVMFDIPFYMSHHKPKMIAALVAEANRVYRLWCRNNPGFSEHGRVHLIAHSLGSVMALEILSKQPTVVPRLDLTRELPSSDLFEFDTNNLFFIGSPAGFFLLLERGNLVPRRGRLKQDSDPADVFDDDLVGDAGTFGCLAVNNIYNILAREDPIGYLLNGTIDPNYASSLRVAYVPSASMSLFQSLGNSIRGITGGPPAEPAVPDSGAKKPPTTRLPSQLELEVHDFTREDIAEKKAYLLNDNGQIDYFLRSGGGPLEIQYLNMLSAHTSYWYNPDLIRMLCMEVGRKPGRKSTIPSLRAVKAANRQLPLGR